MAEVSRIPAAAAAARRATAVHRYADRARPQRHPAPRAPAAERGGFPARDYAHLRGLVHALGLDTLIERLQTAFGPLKDVAEAVAHPRAAGANLVEQLSEYLRKRLDRVQGITAAYVNSDGTQFVLTGPEWTAELNLEGATIASEAQRKLAPSGRPYIEGGFFERSNETARGWRQVYP